MSLILLFLFPLAMVLAAGTDLLDMTISNKLVGALAVAFVAFAFVAGWPVAAIGVHVLAALAILLVTFGCFAAGWMGGGDAKLIAAVALWLGPTAELAQFALLSSIFGGVLTLALLMARRLTSPTTGLVSVDRLLSPETGVPYGVALGAAGLVVFAQGSLGAPLMALVSASF